MMPYQCETHLQGSIPIISAISLIHEQSDSTTMHQTTVNQNRLSR
jgi:hypothetical protein